MQGQARLSEVCSTWAEQVQEANAALRELVCRRFKWVPVRASVRQGACGRFQGTAAVSPWDKDVLTVAVCWLKQSYVASLSETCLLVQPAAITPRHNIALTAAWMSTMQQALCTPDQGPCSFWYRQVDLVRVAAGDFGEQEELTAEEDPAFQRRLRENRSVGRWTAYVCSCYSTQIVAPPSSSLPASRSAACSSERFKKFSSLSRAQQPFMLAVEVDWSQHGNKLLVPSMLLPAAFLCQLW